MKILIAGDYRPIREIIDRFEKDEFESVFGEVRSIISEVDYAIVNLESPIVEHEAIPITKHGPSLKIKASSIKAIKWAGFSCVTLANNHFLDYGEIGANDTLINCQKQGIDTVGGGKNIEEASRILYKEFAGQRLAIINCCENEFSIATSSSAGSNPLNPIKQFYDIQEAKSKADRVVVIVHGGIEGFQLPTPRMVETYRFFIDSGADAVVNHHQHCYSGYEVYRGKPIFYGLGNFCYYTPYERYKNWYEGFVVMLDLSQMSPSFQLFPYIQNAEEFGIFFRVPGDFNDRINQLNKIIEDKDALKKAIEQYYSNTTNALNIFEPLYNKFYFLFRNKKLLPSLISKNRLLAAKNSVFCESHRDKLQWWLLNSIKPN